VNKFERYSILIGIGLSAFSALASAYAAYQTAQQAVYARHALSASDLNRTFEEFYTSWSNLCKVLDPTPSGMVFDVEARPNEGSLVVTASDLGYSYAKFDRSKYRADVSRAIAETNEKYNHLSLWLPPEQLTAIGFEHTMSNLVVLSRVPVSSNEAVRYATIFRQIGYCSFWLPQLTQWFQHREWNIPVISSDKVKLNFQTDIVEPLTDEHIKLRRSGQYTLFKTP